MGGIICICHLCDQCTISHVKRKSTNNTGTDCGSLYFSLFVPKTVLILTKLSVKLLWNKNPYEDQVKSKQCNRYIFTLDIYLLQFYLRTVGRFLQNMKYRLLKPLKGFLGYHQESTFSLVLEYNGAFSLTT